MFLCDCDTKFCTKIDCGKTKLKFLNQQHLPKTVKMAVEIINKQDNPRVKTNCWIFQ